MRSILNIRKRGKKGAIELSMTTVVVIVLAMTMLALGLTLVRTLFKGAIWTAESLNENMHKEIQKMFSEEGKDLLIVGPTNRVLGVCPGTKAYLHYYLATKTGGVIKLGIKTDKITTQTGQQTPCGSFNPTSIVTRLSVPPGQSYAPNDIAKTDTILIDIPSNAPAGCEFYITMSATYPGVQTPQDDSMIVQIKPRGVLGCTSD